MLTAWIAEWVTGQISVCHSDKNKTFIDGDNNGHGNKNGYVWTGS